MRRARWIGLLLLLLGCGFCLGWGFSLERTAPDAMGDFKIVYHAARCFLQHSDPYNSSIFESVYRAQGWELPLASTSLQGAKIYINLPAAFILTVPFAMLPWGLAHVLWIILSSTGLVLAAYLMWNLGAEYAPILSGCLIGFLAANSEVFLGGGNLTAIVASLCVVAVWCFFKDKYVLGGVLCMALSLAIKPHNAGFVWLYFLLAGGIYRKRALQTLAVTAVLSLASVLWVSPVAPHWAPELHNNLATISARGSLNDPGPTMVHGPDPDELISIQTVVSVFWDDPRVYNPVGYLICGALLLVWLVRTLLPRVFPRRAWLALAAVVPLTMLVTYHRPYDAKLLLLTVPACAMLWAEGGLLGLGALLMNAAGFVLIGDVPLAILMILTRGLRLSTSALSGQILTVALMRPTPIILLAMGIFYLWVYLRRALLDGECRIADATLARG